MSTLGHSKPAPRRRINAPVLTTGKARTTLCLPETMLVKIHQIMDEEGVSRKRRSKWIENSIQRLFELDGYEELVLEEFIDPGHNKTISVSLSAPIKIEIDRVVNKLGRTTERPVESSALLRTAISQYLLRTKAGR